MRLHTYFKGISSKVNLQLEFEFTYYEAAVQPFNHYAMTFSSNRIKTQHRY